MYSLSLSLSSVCACMCVQVHVGVSACTRVLVHIVVKGQPWLSSFSSIFVHPGCVSSSFLGWRGVRVSHCPRTAKLEAKLAGQGDLGICLSLCLRHWDYNQSTTVAHFSCVYLRWTSGLHACMGVLYWRNCLPTPNIL